MAESEEELKSLLIKAKEESENAPLKLNIQKLNIIASSSTTSWKIDGAKVEIGSDLIFLGSKINSDSDCNHRSKKHLLLGKITMTNLDMYQKSETSLC